MAKQNILKVALQQLTLGPKRSRGSILRKNSQDTKSMQLPNL